MVSLRISAFLRYLFLRISALFSNKSLRISALFILFPLVIGILYLPLHRIKLEKRWQKEYLGERSMSKCWVGNKLYYHTWPTPSGKHNYEIDFLLSRNAKICPIEVKSSRSNLHVSIDEFQKKFSSRILKRYLLHSKDIRKEQDLILLPMYMSLFL